MGYRKGTNCVQAGYQPQNGEPRILPIYQSTTYRYDSADHLGKLFDLEVDPDSKPEELAAFLQEKLQQKEGKNEQEAYLLSILKEYTPEERYDEQMKELLLWGKKETCLWQVSITQ